MLLLLTVLVTQQLITRKFNESLYFKGGGINTAHFSAKTGSIGCLEVLVNDDEVDLDIQNTLEGDTPLHLAVKHASEDHEMAKAMVELLIAGGANIKYRSILFTF